MRNTPSFFQMVYIFEFLFLSDLIHLYDQVKNISFHTQTMKVTNFFIFHYQFDLLVKRYTFLITRILKKKPCISGLPAN